MKELKNYITPIHKSAERDYLDRMINEKTKCIKIAKKYDFDYWDGSRRTGYGGYKYIKGYWKGMAEQLIKDYKLRAGSKVLDVGCGKAFLLHEMKLIEPNLNITGFDISDYALKHNTKLTKPYVYNQKAEEPFKYKDKEIDLVISINTLHNLKFFNLKKAILEINRVGKQAYIVVESYRNEEELFNLECWALTIESFFSVVEWEWIYDEFNYTGDYEFIFFE